MIEKKFKHFSDIFFLIAVAVIAFGVIFYSQKNSDAEIKNILSASKICEQKTGSKEKLDCLKLLFEKIGEQNYTEKSFQLVNNLIKDDIFLTESCHYILHGVGAGNIKKNLNNLEVFFAVDLTGEYLKIPPTCSQGYFHGGIEYLLQEIKYQDQGNFSEMASKVCEKVSESDDRKVNCYHGLGHGFMIYREYNQEKAIQDCNKVSKVQNMQSMCRTGVFMEMLRVSSYLDDAEKVTSFRDCEQIDFTYRGECFNQQSYFLKEFGQKKTEFDENMEKCGVLKDTYGRIYCIRSFKF